MLQKQSEDQYSIYYQLSYFFERHFLKSHTSYTANVSGAKVYLLLFHSHFAKVKYEGGDVELNPELEHGSKQCVFAYK